MLLSQPSHTSFIQSLGSNVSRKMALACELAYHNRAIRRMT
jgi:hypothetical protein